VTRRVAILHYTAPPIAGGVERVIQQHVRLLREAGNSVTVVAGKGGPLRANGAKLVRIPLLAATHRRQQQVAEELAEGRVPEDFYRLTDEIEILLRATIVDQDIVLAHNSLTLHFNQPLAVALSRLAAGRMAGRIVAWTHDIAAVNALYKTEMHPGYPWEVLCRPQAGVRYVCISEERRRQLLDAWRSEGHGESDVCVIPNGIDIEGALRLSQSSRQMVEGHGLFDRNPIMLLPVRITRRKNIELAIEVVHALREGGLAPVLVVTGPRAPHHPERSQAYLAELREMAARLGVLNDVVFVADQIGRTLSEREVADLYAVSDVLFLPSASEGFGLPLLEAAAVRLPVVATDLPVFREIAGESGLYFRLDWPISRVAALVEEVTRDPRHVVSSESKRMYRWETVYRRHIEPLLKATPVRQSPGGRSAALS
jgi:glycosyltransferase involved in cell wall biosynthesis